MRTFDLEQVLRLRLEDIGTIVDAEFEGLALTDKAARFDEMEKRLERVGKLVMEILS